MAANLDMSNDRVNFAYVGDVSNIWHSLGQSVPADADLNTWKDAAGMTWMAKESPILFNNGNDMPTVFPDKKALFRSDTNFPLSIVGKDYKIVQPGEILDFFDELLQRHDMKMDTAGCLFSGKRFFASAKLGDDIEIISGDKIKGHLLLTTSLDGTLATTGKVVSTRVVCNNTLTMALNESSKNMVKVSHATEFDATSAKIDLGLIEETRGTFIENMRKLASASCTDSDALKFYQDMYYNKDVAADEQHGSIEKKVREMFNSYLNGAGANFHRGSLYGVLQGVTDYHTHSVKSRTDSAKFWNSFYTSDKPKLAAQQKLLQMVV
jgi:phage/plasmid-like protein (TIGR03299 family)